eukprot:CCRYP_011973-RA/>CCRYP_011973-RA protein AED:0.36 eAED:0.62 QI:0/0/0/0.5/1/1/2/0/132
MMSFVSSWPKGSNRVALPSEILLVQRTGSIGPPQKQQECWSHPSWSTPPWTLRHTQAVSDKRGRCKEGRVEDGKKVVEAMSLRQGPKVKKRLDRMKETGAWLAVIPDRFSGTALSLQEWHDNLSRTTLPHYC